MPYDEDGNYTSAVPRDEHGFVNMVAPPTPFPHTGPLTAEDAACFIQKDVG